MRRSGQNMRVAKCLKFSGCGVHLEITLSNFILRTNPVLVQMLQFSFLPDKTADGGTVK